MSSGNPAHLRRGYGYPTKGSFPTGGEAKLKIAILGAGSVGCFIGGCWQAAGMDVRFIGRPSFAGDVHRYGIRLSDYGGWSAELPPTEVDYQGEPGGLADADIIALCVKSGATADAADEIARYGSDGATAISFQNGISNIEMLNRALDGRFKIVRGMVPYNVAYLGEGRFHKGVAGDLHAEDLGKTRELARQVRHSRTPLKLSGDMLGLAWGKLLINLNNAVSALSGKTLRAELAERDYRRIFAGSMSEGLDLLDKARITPSTVGGIGPKLLPLVINSPDWLFNSVFMKKWKIDPKARSSMADDLAAGRRTEVDYINGELVRLAERLGIDAPINRKIVELIRKAEAGAPPRSSSELCDEVLGR